MEDHSNTQGGSPDQALIITRTFNAPTDRVWRALTNEHLLAKWWSPKGFKINQKSFDLKPGGIFHYSMTAPNGYEMWGKLTFTEIVAPQKLVFTNAFADAEGNTIRNPFLLKLALETLVTVTIEEQEGSTLMTLHSIPFNATPDEGAAFAAILTSMQQAFVGTFDQLDELLQLP